MITDLQKANILKRISAYILDVILLITLAVGFGWLLSSALHYDSYLTTLETRTAYYETQYGVDLGITQDTYEAMTSEQMENFDAASKALNQDEQALYAYNMVINLTLVIVSLTLLLAYVVLELIVPLLLRNGQTIGKKAFSIAVIRVDGVQVTPFALFVRTVLGKFTMETMVPLCVVMLVILGSAGLLGTVLLVGFYVAQLCLVAFRQDHGLIHDLVAATVVVDMQSQMIFKTPEDLIAYKQRIHAEEARKKKY